MPRIGSQDEFEGLYRERFRTLVRPFGEFVTYERDRAAIDLGLQLTEATTLGRTVKPVRVWFQLKGIRRETLDAQTFAQSSYVHLRLPIDHLRFWYASPEVVYLAAYVESADTFVAEDILDVVGRRWGEAIFDPGVFKPQQKEATVRLATSQRLTPKVLSRLGSHRSFRVDGPAFRGRPLGHRLDPLRSIPNQFEPRAFADIVHSILSAHYYQQTGQIDSHILFPDRTDDIVEISYGMMHHTFEWALQMMTEFGIGPQSDFRVEGEPLHVQGPCGVLIHSQKESVPHPDRIRALFTVLAERKIPTLLVLVNAHEDPSYFGAFFRPAREMGVTCMPQHLGDFAFNLLTATQVYLTFREQISWRHANYL